MRVRRARRYILRVRPDGTVRVTVPRGGSRREAEQFMRRHEKWIARERNRVRIEHAAPRWQDGTTILIDGEPSRIAVEPRGDAWHVRYGDRAVAARDVSDLRAVIERDLRELAKATLLPRLRELAAQHALEVGGVSIRNQRSRWGSCARNGNIALNFRLVQMPRGGARLRAHPRADAHQAAESFAALLAPRRGRLPGVPRRRAVVEDDGENALLMLNAEC